MKQLLRFNFMGMLILCTCSVLFAQQDVDSDEPVPGVIVTPDLSMLSGYGNNTTAPQLKSSSVVFYSDGVSVSIEFKTLATSPISIFLVDQNNPNNVRTQTVTGGKAEIFGLAVNKTYDIKTIFQGVQYSLGTVSTYPFSPGDPIVVSPELYRALSMYVTPTTQHTKLSNYLIPLSHISTHEKTAFAQQFFMNGSILPANMKGQYPTTLVTQALNQRIMGSPCLCNMVVKAVPSAIPDKIANDFAITSSDTIIGPNWYNSNSYWWQASKQMGPAKDMRLVNSGNLAGNKLRSKIWKIGESGNSNKEVQLGYNYLCLNESETPAECVCEKKVKFDFSYNTRLDAESNTGGTGCIFSQSAASRAQDWAVAFITYEKQQGVQDVVVLESGLAVATSTCNGGQPVSVILDAIKIGTEVIKTIGEIKTGSLGNILEATNVIVNLVGGILEQLFEEKQCSDAIIETPLLKNSTVVTLRSNDPISFVIVSGSEMDVTGKRCWASIAKINSSFHATGLLMGGYPNQSSIHCCTDYVASWAFGSYLGDENSHKTAIASYLGLNGPNVWQSINGVPNNGGALNITTQLGTAVGSAFPNGGQCPSQSPNLGDLPR